MTPPCAAGRRPGNARALPRGALRIGERDYAPMPDLAVLRPRLPARSYPDPLTILLVAGPRVQRISRGGTLTMETFPDVTPRVTELLP